MLLSFFQTSCQQDNASFEIELSSLVLHLWIHETFPECNWRFWNLLNFQQIWNKKCLSFWHENHCTFLGCRLFFFISLQTFCLLWGEVGKLVLHFNGCWYVWLFYVFYKNNCQNALCPPLSYCYSYSVSLGLSPTPFSFDIILQRITCSDVPLSAAFEYLCSNFSSPSFQP